VIGVTLGAALSFACLLAVPQICAAWTDLFRAWHAALGLPGGVEVVERGWPRYLTFQVPYLALPGHLPGPAEWWGGAAGALLLVLVSLPLARRSLPLAYFLRVMAGIQATAQAFFAVAPERFPYDLPSYTAGMLVAGLSILVLSPLLLGATYNIFNLGVRRKLLLALVTVLHLGLFVPHQFLLHAYLVHHGSYLFLPLLYFLFGLLLDVMAFIAWYAWGMSWPERTREAAQQPGLRPQARPGRPRWGAR
jgi:hypothetical protein